MRNEEKYPRWGQAQRIRRLRVEEERRERARIEYERQRDAYNNSPKGMFERQVREAVQQVSKTEDEAFAKMFQALKELREQTIELIAQLVATEKEKFGYVRTAVIRLALDQTDIAVQKIKKMSEMPEYQKRLSKGAYTDYEKLFNALIDTVDVGFAMFAPIKSLIRKSIKFNRLNDEVKDYVFDHIVSLGLVDDEEFIEQYYSAFKYQIENGTSISD
ncbi:MAG: hypothetical protein IJW36_00330 [Clostridia bacterium]|nr:hypothetical protein [Clostridia bacterium]